MSAVTVFYKGTGGFTPPGSYWQIASGVLGPNGQVLPQPNNTPYFDGIPQPYHPGACTVLVSRNAPNNPPASLHAGVVPLPLVPHLPAAGRYWTFQGIETGIFLVLAAGS